MNPLAAAFNWIANFRRPVCAALPPAGAVGRPNPWRMSWQSANPHHVCAGRQAQLRFGDQGRVRFGLVSVAAFFTSAILGFAVVRQVPALMWIDGAGQVEPTFAAFLLVLVGGVFPATALCQRLLIVETVT